MKRSKKTKNKTKKKENDDSDDTQTHTQDKKDELVGNTSMRWSRHVYNSM